MKTSNGDAKHYSFLAMSDTTQLDDSKQNWWGTKLKMVRQISDAL